MAITNHTHNNVSKTDVAVNDSDARFDDVILNIGLDGVSEHINGDGSLLSRADVAFAAVRALGFKVLESKMIQSDSEQTIVLRAACTGDLAASTSWLSDQLNQDCIAVWVPSQSSGALYGSGASKWGEFNAEFFFDMGGARLSETLRAAA